MIRIGIVGYGYWGPNLVRNFFEAKETQVACVSDLREDRLAALTSRYPTVRTTRDFRELIEDPSIDAVAIATPVSTHYELALRALQQGKHVLVEKPLASDASQVQHLMEVAQKRNRVLMVDHTFRLHRLVRKIRELVESGGLGEIYYYDAVRVNLGLFQHDMNVLWDLAVHDLCDHGLFCRFTLRGLRDRNRHVAEEPRTSHTSHYFFNATRSRTFMRTGWRQ